MSVCCGRRDDGTFVVVVVVVLIVGDVPIPFGQQLEFAGRRPELGVDATAASFAPRLGPRRDGVEAPRGACAARTRRTSLAVDPIYEAGSGTGARGQRAQKRCAAEILGSSELRFTRPVTKPESHAERINGLGLVDR
ncbi:unnamed protein product [Lampetra planeri]